LAGMQTEKYIQRRPRSSWPTFLTDWLLSQRWMLPSLQPRLTE